MSQFHGNTPARTVHTTVLHSSSVGYPGPSPWPCRRGRWTSTQGSWGCCSSWSSQPTFWRRLMFVTGIAFRWGAGVGVGGRVLGFLDRTTVTAARLTVLCGFRFLGTNTWEGSQSKVARDPGDDLERCFAVNPRPPRCRRMTNRRAQATPSQVQRSLCDKTATRPRPRPHPPTLFLFGAHPFLVFGNHSSRAQRDRPRSEGELDRRHQQHCRLFAFLRVARAVRSYAVTQVRLLPR